ncbi:CLUMA_CG016323, isoform A [Clunio marinus]|uniref:CLUMA_CG016323, isoform A n=1 Tax=Clunio marinus TaxID=568069 RepID=A0A1J1IU53_9DIPT|nr:CLUMA_CG016323, isoform A [Clunio marinus]
MKIIGICIILNLILFTYLVSSKKTSKDEKPEWAKKDIRDYTEADLERLLDQWEEDEEPLEPDELPEHLRPRPPVDFSKIDMNNPEELLQQTKKGQTVMTFVTVSGNPTRDEAEEITKLWQTSLWNNHIQAERYMIDTNRAIFMFSEGAQSWAAKDFLIEQERCESVTLENKVYPGKFSSQKDEL